MYRNLEAEIARAGMSREECSVAIGKSKQTFDRLIAGKQPFRLGEMMLLKAELNSRLDADFTLDYLFEEVPHGAGVADSRAHGSSVRPN